MSARAEWYRETALRRGLHRPARPLASQLLKWGAGRGAAIAATRSLIEEIGGRNVVLTFQRGSSHARLDAGVVNLDERIFESGDPRLQIAERLLGVGAHEAGHFLCTPSDFIPRDPLFRVIHNILEDERIEAEVARRYPCVVHPLHAARRDLLDVAGEDDGFLAAVFSLVRCEAPIPEALWRRYESRLRAVLDDLHPYPRTPEAVRIATLRVAMRVPPDELEQIPIDTRFVWLGGGELEEADAASGVRVLGNMDSRRGRRPRGALADRGAWPEVTWREAEDAPDGYAACCANLGGRAAALADRLRTLLPPEPIPRQRSGRVDRRRLHAYPYTDRLFRRRSDPRAALSVSLIIDLSGSMLGSSAEVAQMVAVLLSEAVARLPDARLDVYGHSADLDRGTASTCITRFPTDRSGRPLGIGSLPIDGNNRDAHAIELIGEDLLASPARTSRYRLAVIIADGAPSAMDFRGEPARRQTRDSILWLERVWGPVLFIATDSAEELRSMVPGPSFRFQADRPVDELARHLTVTLRRAPGSRR
jgi:hypothetical protein